MYDPARLRAESEPDPVQLCEILPTSAGHIDVPSDFDVDLSKPDGVTLLLACIQVQQEEIADIPFALDRFTEMVLSDLRNVTRVAPQCPEAVLALLTVGTCWVPARRAFRSAKSLEMWRWVHRAFATGDGIGQTAEIDSGPADRALRDHVWGPLVQLALVRLAPVLFHLAHQYDMAGDLAPHYEQNVFAICLPRLSTGDEASIEALVHLTAYLSKQGKSRQANELGHALERFLFTCPAHPLAGAVATLLASARPAITHQAPGAIAAWAFQHVSLDPHERLSLHVAASAEDVNDDVRFATLMKQLVTVGAFIDAQNDPLQASRDRGSIFSILGPLQRPLLAAGRTDRLLEVLGAWKGVPADQLRDDRCVTLGNTGSGVWYRPGPGPGSGRADSLVRLTKALNRALGLALVTGGMDDTALIAPADDEKRTEHAAELETALRDHFDVEDLADYINEQDASALVPLLPSLVPTQALLARSGGPVPPLAASFRKPLPDRAVSRVQLWCGDAPAATAEVRLLAAIFSNNFIEVDLVTGPDVTQKRFLSEYQRDDYDVIWVVSHGANPPYEPDRAAIVLNDTETVHLDDLVHAAAPTASGRRLLVLNTCQSAAADMQGPYDDRGIARSVVGPGQAVVGHLWRVDGHAAAVFGALLAIELAAESTFVKAFADALHHFQDWRALDKHFDGRGIGALVSELLQELPEPTILDWGSPVFME
ncbi:CHAT domain-containing protein [Kitasatospora phosalacinea]|uniref:CHAT domain-containing protein n=1 Tax=Kitasatospora phosalacinea TaxID=2065 RepID=UPI00365F98F0